MLAILICLCHTKGYYNLYKLKKDFPWIDNLRDFSKLDILIFKKLCVDFYSNI